MGTLSEYVMQFLVKSNVHDIFLVSGGGIAHLVDAAGRTKGLRYISTYHEQAASIAAESYARFTGTIGACLVTTGPGSTNAVTGVADCWVESIPLLVISGQVKREVMADYSTMRQMAPQEINIVDVVKPITKYAVTIMDPLHIRYELEKAFYLATTGRPGPVWINIPLDVQAAQLDVPSLKGFTQPKKSASTVKKLQQSVRQSIRMIKHAKRPALICGFGIRLAGAHGLLEQFIKKVNMPILIHINGVDLVPYTNKLLMGQYGPYGMRRGNFVVQNADLLLSVGASLDITATGFNYTDFGRNAKKIMVNVDASEVHKKTLSIDLPIIADAKGFMEELLRQLQVSGFKPQASRKWYTACEYWKKTYPSIVPEFFVDKKHVNTYVFFDRLSDILSPSDTVTTGIGFDVVAYYHAFKVKKGQRSFNNEHFGGMGWCLPGAVGACIGNARRRHICVTGDGSMQFNIHELATISKNNLPVKIFVFNNGGYESIRSMQQNLFGGHLVGADETSGVKNPDFKLLAKAYGISYGYIRTNNEIEKKVKQALQSPGPTLYEVNVAVNQIRIPKSQTRKLPDGSFVSPKLEDLWPFLPEEEMKKNMTMFD